MSKNNKGLRLQRGVLAPADCSVCARLCAVLSTEHVVGPTRGEREGRKLKEGTLSGAGHCGTRDPGTRGSSKSNSRLQTAARASLRQPLTSEEGRGLIFPTRGVTPALDRVSTDHLSVFWLSRTTMALCLTQVFNKDRTFRPRKKFEPGTQRFELYKKAQASLKSGLDLKTVVQLPPGENINDWIAVHVVDFFNRINLIYGTMSEFCTDRSCPNMSGGLRYEYRWQDDHKYKKPTKLSAPQYMSMLMDWIENLINNEDIFPTRTGTPFPKNFQQVCTKILTRLFRVFVHVYIHHFDGVINVGAEAHVNTCYKHFYYFITEFSLVDYRELEPLREMTEKICH
ncbi:hypothetical protein NDU88_001814 [Pleurodeles waltl]|uniref:MOB kinase activator 3C n=2 Tax=Pleurodeles waltl TaxID=8319 RepID=A0AAV7T1K6_PLEWA|nr:hypothetical protein NDU88_001814 [Pleurodeles waltl]